MFDKETIERLEKLKQAGEAPSWLTIEGYKTLTEGYLLPNETPIGLYKRVSNAAASRLNKPELASRFFEIINNNWLCLATPVAANMGAVRGLPISCYASSIIDTTDDIFKSYHEIAMLAKYGGGLGKYWGHIRGRGFPISGGGVSEGIVPWLKIEEQVIQGVAQGTTRRGAVAAYLDIEHVDGEEFIDIRRPTGDISRRCLSTNFHHGVCISDKFMHEMLDGSEKNRELWSSLLKARVETGEPYVMFKDNANNQRPQSYVNNNLFIETSNLCSEIFLHTDKDHTFVCCLSSLNLARWDEFKDTDTIQLAIWFLDGVMTEFISKAKLLPGLDKAVRFAEKSRALGLGVLGWHTLLQSKMIPFDSFQAMQLNGQIFRKINSESLKASEDLAKEYGEPLWCTGLGIRNTHRMAIAPTVSNSLISGGVSQGVEPVIGNWYAQKSAKGTFIRKNPVLEKLLIDTKRNSEEVWTQIKTDQGSVKNVKNLSDEEKEVFLTAREINQFAIVKQAGQRQKWIDQGQSVNLFFSVPDDIQDSSLKKKLGNYIHNVHMEAWKEGLKSLYYCRTESSLRGDSVYRESSECKACEG
jgi:ribonucleoside-diphosphate reductase alpha chain